MPYLPPQDTDGPFRRGYNPGATVNGSNDPAGMLPWQQAVINAPNAKPIPQTPMPPSGPTVNGTSDPTQGPWWSWPITTAPGGQPVVNGTLQPPPPTPPTPVGVPPSPDPPPVGVPPGPGPSPWTPTPANAPLGYVPPWLAEQYANNPPPAAPPANELLFPPEQFNQIMANQGMVMGPNGGWITNNQPQGLNTQNAGSTPWVPTVGNAPPSGVWNGNSTPSGAGYNISSSGPNFNTVAAQPGSGFSTTAPGSVPSGSAGANAQGVWNAPTPTQGSPVASATTSTGPTARTPTLGSRLLPPALRNNGRITNGRTP